jgi:TolB-like protein
MSDVFISYARSTETQAQAAAEALRGLGYSVWLDDQLPAHRAYTHVIAEELTAAKATLVIWSADAAKSEWVMSEANRAREARKLVQLTVDGARLPMPFDQIQCADLLHWDLEAAGWRKVVASIADLVGGPASTPTTQAPLPRPSKPSVAVMPFVNPSGDPEQEYFADGMVVEITNALCRFKSLFVIASSSSLTFKGKAVGAQAAAKQLGVRYVLEGSVRKAGNRIRIAVELIDADNGVQIWSQRFDDTLEDVFDLQDKVALAVAGVIVPTVKEAEIRRAERLTENLTSYDLFMRSWPLSIVATAGELQEALNLLDRAIALDPSYGPALSRAAMGYRNRYQFGWSDDPEHDRRHAIDLAHRALAATTDDADVLVGAGSVLGRLGGDLVAAVALVDRALALNPGSSSAWFSSGRLRVNMGDAELGAQHIETSMRLDPLSRLRAAQLQALGLARFAQQRFSEALALVQESAQLAPEYRYTQLLLAACQGQLGHGQAARAALARARASNPGVDVLAFANQSLHLAAQRQLLLDGLAVAEGKSPADDAG